LNKETKLDWSHDFYNGRHLNYWGRKKVTAYLSKEIKKLVALEDKRGQENMKVWDQAYDNYVKDSEKMLQGK
jgi:hypothetical protein